MNGPPLRVLCVDDQRAFRDAIQVAIAAQDDLDCVGGANDVEQGLAAVEHDDVDVVLMDYDLPGVDGVEGTRRVKALRPEVRVVVLTALADLETFVRATAAGADAFVAKDSPLETITDALRGDRTLDPVLDDATVRALRERVRTTAGVGDRGWSPDLTDREREVLALLAAGIDPQTIARQLGIRVHTSRGYVRNVLVKLGAHSQLEAVAVARRLGLLRDGTDAPRVSR